MTKSDSFQPFLVNGRISSSNELFTAVSGIRRKQWSFFAQFCFAQTGCGTKMAPTGTSAEFCVRHFSERDSRHILRAHATTKERKQQHPHTPQPAASTRRNLERRHASDEKRTRAYPAAQRRAHAKNPLHPDDNESTRRWTARKARETAHNIYSSAREARDAFAACKPRRANRAKRFTTFTLWREKRA